MIRKQNIWREWRWQKSVSSMVGSGRYGRNGQYYSGWFLIL